MKNTFKIYFERYAASKALISIPPSKSLGMCIVLPSFNEPDLQGSLECLNNCILPECDIEIIVLINEPKNVSDKISSQNVKSFEQANAWSRAINTSRLYFHIIYIKDIPEKKHGVGMARKMGMDEAAKRFYINNYLKEGIIVAFDADSTCTPDFLVEIEKHFKQFMICPGVSIYFEHQFAKIKNKNRREGIIQYEIHLRYLIQMQRYAGYSNAFHTVGSSMAVRAEAYIKAGGMNTRKAGEDFYFLHRIISMGNYMELNIPVVYPSSRESNRVPFGTGRAMLQWSENNQYQWLTYNPKTFMALKVLLESTNRSSTSKEILQDLPESIGSFLVEDQFEEKWNKIITGTTSESTFQKRFFGYFDAFKILKYMRHSRENYFDDLPVKDAVHWLLADHFKINQPPAGSDELLDILRKIDRRNSIANQTGYPHQ